MARVQGLRVKLRVGLNLGVLNRLLLEESDDVTMHVLNRAVGINSTELPKGAVPCDHCDITGVRF